MPIVVKIIGTFLFGGLTLEYIRIDGVLMPAPKSYGIDRSDLDSENTSRSLSGIMNRDRVRQGVYKIKASWLVNTIELVKLTQALAPESIQVKFFDGTTGMYVTTKMYAGDRSSTIALQKKNYNETLWEFSCDLIEY